MTEAEQLAALEAVAKWIDPKRTLWRDEPGAIRFYNHFGAIDEITDTRIEVTPTEEVALAIRIKQAMDWLTAWCDEHDAIAHPCWDVRPPSPFSPSWSIRLTFDKLSHRWFNSNDSWAHVLAKTVAALAGKEPNDG